MDIRTSRTPESPDAVLPNDYREIISKVRKLNNPDRNWSKTFMVFALTLALFSMTGWVRFNDPVFLGILVGVLFFHELGHFVAMRFFGYRNVRMFFIPFFGAAVSGRCFQSSGWKKAMVAIMGPLPGVLLGTFLIAAPLWGYPSRLSIRVGAVLLFLNLFNLLPIIPFDGGRYLNAILFCRNRWLQTGFRLITNLLLGLLAWKLHSVILGAITGLMLVTTSASFHCATIANNLRNDLTVPDAGGDEIPEQACVAIIEQIKTKMPQLKTDARVAATVLNIYETATTRPPSWLVSIALLILYPVLFLCPLAPWAYAVWRNPKQLHEWQIQLRKGQAARHNQAIGQPEMRRAAENSE